VVATTTCASRIRSSTAAISMPLARARSWASSFGSQASTRPAPPSRMSAAIPKPAAPSPSWPTVTSRRSIPTWRQATITAERATTAVP